MKPLAPCKPRINSLFVRLCANLALLLFLLLPAAADILRIGAAAYSVDLPAGWTVLDQTDLARVAYISPGSSLVLKVMVYEQKQYPAAVTLADDIEKQLQAKGEGAPFDFYGMDAVLADFSFTAGKLAVRGYTILINGSPFDYALVTFCPLDIYDDMADAMLSALDSFALAGEGSPRPGPVSCFMSQGEGDRVVSRELELGSRALTLQASQNALTVSGDIIEREARLLAAFPTVNLEAWYRFYRMIYRDNYTRVGQLAQPLLQVLAELPLKEQIEILLNWIQGFTFTKTGTLADFTSPLEAALNQAGDCDSRVMLFLILLHQLKVDAVLLVSAVYSHAAAGISQAAYPAKGAVVQVGGKPYLYTELTEQVDIGLIPQARARAENWIGFTLGSR